MSDQTRRVLMSQIVADRLRLGDRFRLIDLNGYEGGLGVADVTEAELLANGASRVEWGEPDERGFYTPMLYAEDQPVAVR